MSEKKNEDNKPPQGFKALFNGRDLDGWKGLVEDPIKRAKMSPDELKAKQEKADEQMREEYKRLGYRLQTIESLMVRTLVSVGLAVFTVLAAAKSFVALNVLVTGVPTTAPVMTSGFGVSVTL